MFSFLREINPSRTRIAEANRRFAELIPAGALVLDAGAGTAPYRHLFKHARYETADFTKLEIEYAQQTYVCDLAAIPVEDSRFDFIVFNQVMEHLPEPFAALREFHRVLKPGGRIIYTAPLFYEEHNQPYDFYRYTQFGVRHLFGKAGFEIERLERLDGFFGTLGYVFFAAARNLPTDAARFGGGWRGRSAWLGVHLTRVLCRIAAPLFQRLELRVKVVDRGFSTNYLAIVRKPEAATP